MTKFIIKRLLAMIPVLLGITFIVFMMLRLTPGDPARSLAAADATEAEIAQLREEMGLNEPLLIQYVEYLKDLVLHGDLGISYTSHRNVTEEILARFPTTFLLALFGVFINVIVGIPLGILSAIKQNSWVDKVCTFIGMFGVSMPSFWFGLLLSYFFALKLGWLPPTGFYGPQYWILPAVTLGLGATATIMRFTRSQMLEVIRQDYITTAEAKGASEKRVVLKHAMKNCLIPLITVIGLNFGHLLGGAMVTETIFAVPGLGKFLVESIQLRDYPSIQGGVLFTAVVFSFMNLIVDILYAYADPRIRAQ